MDGVIYKSPLSTKFTLEFNAEFTYAAVKDVILEATNAFTIFE